MNTVMSKIFIRATAGVASTLLAVGALSLRPDPAAAQGARTPSGATVGRSMGRLQ